MMTERRAFARETYLRDLRRGLQGLPTDEIDDIVREIDSHLEEGSHGGTSIESMIRRFGPAADLAARYRTEAQLARARAGYSPFALMHALIQWASISIFGFLIALVGLVGYGLGLSLLIAAALKPFSADVGLWVGHGTVIIGVIDDPAAREVLGWWIIPLGLLGGMALIIATSRGLRWLIGRRRRTGR